MDFLEISYLQNTVDSSRARATVFKEKCRIRIMKINITKVKIHDFI